MDVNDPCSKYNSPFGTLKELATWVSENNQHFSQKNRFCTYEGIMDQFSLFEKSNIDGVFIIVYITKELDPNSVSVGIKRCYVDEQQNILKVVKSWEDESHYHKEISSFSFSPNKIISTLKNR